MFRFFVARLVGTIVGVVLRPLIRVGGALLLLWIAAWRPSVMWRSLVDRGPILARSSP